MKEIYYNNFKKALSELVSIPSVKGEARENMPFGVEINRALLKTLELCDGLGFKTKNLDGYCGTAEIGEGEEFGILAHVDVVPVNAGWESDPFTLTERDCKLFGRGTEDDKGPALLALYAVKSLLDEGLVPKKKIRFIFGCDEESGWGCIDHFNEVDKMPETGISPDADFPVINCEKGIAHLQLVFPPVKGVKSIKGGTRANVVPDYCEAEIDKDLMKDGEFDISVAEDKGETLVVNASGVAAHGSTPQNGENAIVKLLGKLAPMFDGAESLFKLFKSWDGEGLNVRLSDEQSGDLTMNVGVVDGDENGLVFTIDIRYPITAKVDDIIARIKGIAPQVKVLPLHCQAPLYVAKDDPLVVTLMNAYKEVTGDNTAEPITIGGGTYARALSHGVAFGVTFPGEVEVAHMPNEYLSVENAKKSFDIFRTALEKLCF